jgi:hypothetical protein
MASVRVRLRLPKVIIRRTATAPTPTAAHFRGRPIADNWKSLHFGLSSSASPLLRSGPRLHGPSDRLPSPAKWGGVIVPDALCGRDRSVPHELAARPAIAWEAPSGVIPPSCFLSEEERKSHLYAGTQFQVGRSPNLARSPLGPPRLSLMLSRWHPPNPRRRRC